MSTTHILRRLGVTATAATLLCVVPAVAGAQTARQQRDDAQLAAVKARVKVEVDRRDAELVRLQTQVSSSKRLQAGHRSTLLGQISSTTSGLQSVNLKVQADTDVATARADAQTIVTGYRVFVLVEPRTHLVIAADIEAASAARLSEVAGKLDTAIAAAQAKGKDVTAAKAAVASLRTHIATALGAASSAAGSVIGLTPSGYPGNKSTLSAGRDTLQTGRAALKMALADARAAVADLR